MRSRRDGVQELLDEFQLHQRGVESAAAQVAKVDAKIAEFDGFTCEAELMLHQLRELESGFSRQRRELARGSVHVGLANRA